MAEQEPEIVGGPVEGEDQPTDEQHEAAATQVVSDEVLAEGELAAKMAEALRANPGLDDEQLAEAAGTDVDTVRAIVDSYHYDAAGLSRNGPGFGGGWPGRE